MVRARVAGARGGSKTRIKVGRGWRVKNKLLRGSHVTHPLHGRSRGACSSSSFPVFYNTGNTILQENLPATNGHPFDPRKKRQRVTAPEMRKQGFTFPPWGKWAEPSGRHRDVAEFSLHDFVGLSRHTLSFASDTRGRD